MPEVVEIRKYVDFLKKNLKNRSILKINILKGRYKKAKSFPLSNTLIKNLPLKVLDVKSKGKLIYIIFDNDYYLLNTLGLKGGWVNSKKESPIIDDVDMNHLNVEFKIDNNKSIYFCDSLSFGTLKGLDNKKDLINKLKLLGPDIMEVDTTFNIFKDCIKKNKNLNKKIGNVLVDQKVVSGIGNYLRADILWLSKINPFRLVKNITDKEIKKIYKYARILTWADYNYNKGIELKIIKEKNKLPSNYKRDFFVYDNKTDIYGNKIVKEELYEGSQKRFIYWVPGYQK